MSQDKYVTKVVQRFNMENAKSVGSTLLTNYMVFGRQSPKTKIEKVAMMKVPYASAVGSLMYVMLCSKEDIGYAVEVASRFMRKPGKEH